MLDNKEKAYLKEVIEEAIEEYLYSGYKETDEYIVILKNIANKLEIKLRYGEKQ